MFVKFVKVAQLSESVTELKGLYLDLAHCKTSFEVPLIAHVIAYIGIGYIGHILFSGERMNYKLFHIKYHHDQAEVGQKFYISQ